MMVKTREFIGTTPWFELEEPRAIAPPKTTLGLPPVVLLLLGWRILLFLATIVATQLGREPVPAGLIDVVARSVERWDAGWYLSIAQHGYSLGGEYDRQASVAFYPLLPGLIYLTHLVVPSWRLAGLLVVHLALLGAVLYLDRLVRLDYDRQTALRAVAALLLFPTAPFLGAIYTEPLLLLTMIAALYHARRGQWWLAGLWGAAAGLTKMVGGVILIPLLWEWWRSRAGRPLQPKHLLSQLAALALVPVGALAFLGYLQLRFGSYQVYFTVQQGWHRDSFFQPFLRDALPLLTAFWQGDQSVINYFYPQAGVTLPSTGAFMVLDLLFLLVALIIGVTCCFRLRASYGLLVLAVLAVAIYSGSPQSLNRFALILFPIPIAIAHLARRPLLGFALLVTSGLLCAYHLFLFVNGYWAG